MQAKREALDTITRQPQTAPVETGVHLDGNLLRESAFSADAKLLKSLVGLGRVELPTSPLSVGNNRIMADIKLMQK